MAHESRISPDEELSLRVREAISRSEPLRATALDGMRIEASAGAVVLRGLVASDAHSYLAVQLAAAVPAVTEVRNELLTYDRLEHEVAVALAAAPATEHLRVAVRVVAGGVELYGAVSSLAQADEVLSIARSAARGYSVAGHLQVVPPGEDVLLLWQNSLEGRREEAALRPPKPIEPADDGRAQTPAEMAPASVGGGA